MPKIDRDAYNAATESAGGGGGNRPTFAAGAYVLRVQAVRTEWETRSGIQRADERQCVKIVYDVAEGECANMMSDDGWYHGEDNDYKHCCYLSWKNYGFLKKIMRVFRESNPGFDPEAAFEADRWELFIGKLFGAVIDGEVDTNDRGYDRWKNLKVGEWVSAQDVRNGNHRDPYIEDNRQKVDANPPLVSSGDPYAAEIPF